MKDNPHISTIVSIVSVLIALGVFLFGNNIMDKLKTEKQEKKLTNTEVLTNNNKSNEDNKKENAILKAKVYKELGYNIHRIGLPDNWYLPEEVTFNSLANMKQVFLDMNINIDSYGGNIYLGGVNRSQLSVGGRNQVGEDLKYKLREDKMTLSINGNDKPFYLEVGYKEKFIAIDVSAYKDLLMTLKFKTIDTTSIVSKNFLDF